MFVLDALEDALPVTMVPPPAVFPPVFEFEVVLETVEPEFVILMTTELLHFLPSHCGHSHELFIFLHANFGLSPFGTARNETSTENESVCAALPSTVPSHVIVAVDVATVRLPAHHEIPMYFV